MDIYEEVATDSLYIPADNPYNLNSNKHIQVRMDYNQLLGIERDFSMLMSREKISDTVDEATMPFKELMAYYKCAMMEVETKFSVLNENFSLGHDCNPIAHIKTRLKSPRSILEKMSRYDVPMTTQGIEEGIHDIAGVRVVCHYLSDIYELADALLRQDDVTLVERKDYIRNPKPNGYRSLHLIISTPIFLHNTKRMMKVEVQLRTLAMDTWASQEHQIRYKKDSGATGRSFSEELLYCADMCARVDEIMDNVHQYSKQ